MKTLTKVSEVWHLLRGVACVYKPGDVAIRTIVNNLVKSVVADLNGMERSWSQRHHEDDLDLDPGAADLSRHRLVIGTGFKESDLKVMPINPMLRTASGILLLSVNSPGGHRRVKRMSLPSTCRVTLELGLSTDTGFTSGKVMERSTFKHLVNRPQRLNSLLASIQSSFARVAAERLGCSLQSQEAYEKASRGLLTSGAPRRVPGAGLSPTVEDLRCVEFAPPKVVLDVTGHRCSAEYLASLVHQIGRALKTDAATESVRVMAVGDLGLQDGLHPKDFSAGRVAENISWTEQRLVGLSSASNGRRDDSSDELLLP